MLIEWTCDVCRPCSAVTQCRICLKYLCGPCARSASWASVPVVVCASCLDAGSALRPLFDAERDRHRLTDEAEEERHRQAVEAEEARHLAAVDAIYLRWREAVGAKG